MTVTTSPAPSRSSDRAAWIVSEALAPIVVIPLGTVMVSIYSAGSFGSGVAFAAVAVLFAAGLPYAALLAGVRHGRFDDRQVRARAQRPALLAFTLASVAAGLAVLVWLRAPRHLVVLMVAMVAGMAISLVVSSFWKISIHTSCVAGVVASVAVLITPWAWLLALLVALTGWARMRLRHHTLAQAVTGAVVGALVAGVTLSLLS